MGEEKCGVCVFFATHVQVADFESRIGLMRTVSTLGEAPPKFSWKKL